MTKWESQKNVCSPTKDSDKKCNGKTPHSSSGEGRAPRGPSRPPLSAVQTMGTFIKQYRNKKGRPKSPCN